jgi:hypothetical protein
MHFVKAEAARRGILLIGLIERFFVIGTCNLFFALHPVVKTHKN